MSRGLLGAQSDIQMRQNRKEALKEADVVILAGASTRCLCVYASLCPFRNGMRLPPVLRSSALVEVQSGCCQPKSVTACKGLWDKGTCIMYFCVLEPSCVLEQRATGTGRRGFNPARTARGARKAKMGWRQQRMAFNTSRSRRREGAGECIKAEGSLAETQSASSPWRLRPGMGIESSWLHPLKV